MRTLDLLASDSSHLPFLYVFKESRVMEKYGYEIDLHIVGGAKAPTMAHRAKLALAGEIDFLSGLHHETYRERAKGEKRLTYLAQAQNNWDDRLVASAEIKNVEDLKGRKIVCHAKAPCVSGNLRAVLETRPSGQGFRVAPNEPIVQAVTRAYRRVVGQDLPTAGMSLIANASQFNTIAHVPTVYHGVDQTTAHSGLEHVALDDVVRTARVLIASAVEFTGLAQ